MKHNFCAYLLCALYGLSLCGESESSPKTPENSESSFSGTVGPLLKMAQFGDGFVASLGARVNANFFDTFLVGLTGHGAIAHNTNLRIAGVVEDLSYFNGGVGIGARLFGDSLFHLTPYAMVGLGYLNLKGRKESGLIFTIEPEVNAEFDVFKIMRIGAGLSYRFLMAKDINLKWTDLSGFGGQIYLEFGWL